MRPTIRVAGAAAGVYVRRMPFVAMTAAVLRPPALGPGARIALVAPAGPLRDRADLERAESTARRLGWEPRVGPNALGHVDYFAGPDADRLADLNAALRDPEVDAIWCLRGGYGAMRLLPGVDWGALRARPRALIGYSDITALHCAIAAEVPGLVSYHGPTARAALTPFSERSLLAAVRGEGEPCGAAPDARPLRPGRATGRLAGGNLALLAALAGTRWAPRFDGAIAVFEDVNEATYRVDRMLRQLLLAGSLDGCRGIAFGHCTACPEEHEDDGRRSLAAVVGEIADALGVPAVLGIPLGHIADQWTIPLGATATLDADRPALTLEF
ncbi:MAG: S66 peptidase family protein [Gemmatirosa sp.]